MRVTLVFSPRAGLVVEEWLSLPAQCTVSQALAQASTPGQHDMQGAVAGVWGKRRPGDHPLHEGDRLELYRPLQCDPKEARRLRYRAKPGRALRPKALGWED